MTRGMVSIEPDERGFFHVNYWIEHPHEEDVPPDGFATTAKNATLDDAVALAKKFPPSNVYVWEPCEFCNGTGSDDGEIDGECIDCMGGLVCRELEQSS